MFGSPMVHSILQIFCVNILDVTDGSDISLPPPAASLCILAILTFCPMFIASKSENDPCDYA